MFEANTRVLIVDDMVTMRKLVGKICRELGFTNIVEAADGAKAWEVISTAETPIGLVISDWNMPNCSGIELLKQVRADSNYSKLPFVMVTAEAEAHQIKEAVMAGVSNYIVKPFDTDTLREKLKLVYSKIQSKA